MNPESGVGLHPSTSITPPLTSLHRESGSLLVGRAISQRQQKLPILLPQPQTMYLQRIPEIESNKAVIYQYQYYGPNLISLKEQVQIL